jgi:hypothetical protein
MITFIALRAVVLVAIGISTAAFFATTGVFVKEVEVESFSAV